MTGARSLSIPTLGMTSVIAMLTAACGDSTGSGPLAPVRIEVEPTTAVLGAIGDTVRFTARVYDIHDKSLADRIPIWSSSDEALAAVMNPRVGLVRGLDIGTVRITARLGDITDTAHLTVRQTPARTLFTTGPELASMNQPFDPVPAVEIVDALGTRVVGATDSVVVSLASDDPSAQLLGTTGVRAVNGLAEFPALRIDRPGGGSRLIAAAGELGADTSPPFDVLRMRFATVSAGAFHTCGLAVDSTAYCWGANEAGQLGDASYEERRFPVVVAGGLRFTQLSAGEHHTCGLTGDSTAYCWGANGDGQLGNGTTGEYNEPQPVVSPVHLISMSAGGRHTCALGPDSTAFCWGANDRGQLGDGTGTTRLVPVPVSGDLVYRSLAAGSDHTCGIGYSPRRGYCWGRNDYGQLGDGTVEDRFLPDSLLAGNVPRDRYLRVSAGAHHTCGVGGQAGHEEFAVCWGLNDGFQCGRLADRPYSTRPSSVGWGEFALVSPGLRHTCGIDADGRGSCWGRGFLGYGIPSGPYYEETAFPGYVLAVISSGHRHTCGVTPEGIGYCWGDNDLGQIGNGTEEFAYMEPVRVWQW